MKFRPLAESDLEVYLRWINQKAIWEVDSVLPYEVHTRDSFRDRWASMVRSGSGYIITVAGQEIGYAGLKPRKSDDLSGEFFIVIGEVEAWGKGYGTQAMAWLEQRARSEGLAYLRGRVLGNNSRALAFYDKLGYVVVAEEEPEFERYGNRFRLVVVEKRLEPFVKEYRPTGVCSGRIVGHSAGMESCGAPLIRKIVGSMSMRGTTPYPV